MSRDELGFNLDGKKKNFFAATGYGQTQSSVIGSCGPFTQRQYSRSETITEACNCPVPLYGFMTVFMTLRLGTGTILASHVKPLHRV
jgi:hypothetical protein